SEVVLTNDTVAAGPHYILPAAAWAEKDGMVTNSERRMSRQRAFLPLPGEAKPDWWIICEVARRMGFDEGFAYESAVDIYREHAALTAFENDGTRSLDIGAHASITHEAFDAMLPVQWPLKTGQQIGTSRLFADGGFFTPDRKARMVPLAVPALADRTGETLPYLLNTGRVRDHWHTMTRTGLSPRLAAHIAEPLLWVHPDDIAQAGLRYGGFARVSNAHGSAILKVQADLGARPGSVFAPIHWSGATSSHGRIGAAVQPFTDPFSGQPEMKATPSALAPVKFGSRGFVLSQANVALPEGDWWAEVAVSAGQGKLFASNVALEALQRSMRDQFFGCELVELMDVNAGIYRLAAIKEGVLVGAVFVGPDHDAPVWDAVKALFGQGPLSPRERSAVLSGRSLDGVADTGAIVCACFGVGLNAIREAFVSKAATSPDDIGRMLKAGTNCGSCLPEIRRIGQAALQPA
ncbi:MAG: molybdopterin dinucleotide binding domain-containing protein, partial [Bosea sp. (in: a-proteobacteria)]